MNVTVSRKAHFNAAHKLYNSDWTDARNMVVLENVAIQIFIDIIMS